MTRPAIPCVILALAALAVGAAHADPPKRDGWRDGRRAAGYAPVGRNQGVARSYGGYDVAPGRGRGRDYVPSPAPYEPPLAPYFYQARPNSLGGEWAAQQQDEARQGVRQGRIIPLSRVVQNLERLRPGRVLDAGLEAGPDGRAAYRVRWAAKGGQRIDFIVDAETGAVIGRGAE
ncbi:MAG TPA: PepSY domain-containing protein [Caulobacteraceae bacterium]|nr:PepSY domain-containing protein [Caulobacteraceae bacterium]